MLDENRGRGCLIETGYDNAIHAY